MQLKIEIVTYEFGFASVKILYGPGAKPDSETLERHLRQAIDALEGEIEDRKQVAA